jgi:hypothetical protein
MFTGFASENTPAIQVWDFFRPFALTASPSVSFSDDCAPIQYFRTGSNTATINVYLSSAPIEGKQIKIVNSKYGSNNQTVTIYCSDLRGSGSSVSAYVVGPGQTLDLCYSKNFISAAAGLSFTYTGWISLNQGAASSSNYFSVVSGGNSNAAVGTYSGTFAGLNATASSSQAVVLGGNFNTSSGGTSITGGGTSNTASGNSSGIFAGDNNSAGGAGSAIIGGSTNASGGVNAFVGGGIGNDANAANSVVVGGQAGAARSIIGNFVTPASNAPITVFSGRQQIATLLLGVATTDATSTVLRSDANAAGTTNQVILPNNSAYYFKGSITAGVTGAGNSAMWSFEGGIKRGAGVGTTVLVGTPVLNVVAQDAGASTWVVALTADTTNGGLAVTVTGQAATTIRWVCKVETTEMTY